TTIEIGSASHDEMRAAFTDLHRRRFGYWAEDAEVIVDALVVEALGRTPARSEILSEVTHAGEVFEGPALIFESTSTIVVEEGWRAERANDGTLILRRNAPPNRARAVGT